MSWRITSSIVPRATRKAAQLLLGAVLLATVSLAAATPVPPAPCAYVTGGRMFFCDFYGNGDFGQQATGRWASEPPSVFRCACRTAPSRTCPSSVHITLIPPAPGRAHSTFNPGFPLAYMPEGRRQQAVSALRDLPRPLQERELDVYGQLARYPCEAACPAPQPPPGGPRRRAVRSSPVSRELQGRINWAAAPA